MVKATFHVWRAGLGYIRHLTAESETIEGAAANAADAFARNEESRPGAHIEVYEPIQGYRFTFAFERMRCVARHPWEPIAVPPAFEPRAQRAITLCVTVLEKVLESYAGGYLATTAIDRVKSEVYGARGTGTDLDRACRARDSYGEAMRDIAKDDTKRENVREAARVALKELRELA